jgi:thymidylate synthase ThyX
MANIFIYDEFSPEDTAMMQALYSRSPKSVTEHVDKVKETGSGKFMEKFYVGYGHQSIADCGSTTIFIEQISILADKAIQDWPLYSGQETSTRYVDMSRQPIVDPLNIDESKGILKEWMNFYIKSQEKVQVHLKEKYPRKEEEKESMYNKAIEARTFDIMRGFLPAGITTQLSWHTNLRQAWDKLSGMRYHPLAEVREINDNMVEKLREKYAHSFSHDEYEEQEAYRKYITEEFNYYLPEGDVEDYKFSTTIKEEDLNQYEKLLSSRPIKTGLPYFLGDLGQIQFEFLLDYGSFRDIQRHRSGNGRMPLLTTNYGFNKWYLDELPSEVRREGEELIERQIERIKKLDTTDEIRQYYIGLGFNVTNKITFGLPGAVYTLELRSGKAVHPTLRKVAHKMHHSLAEKFPKLKLTSDLEQDDWDARRGLQDITQKED